MDPESGTTLPFPVPLPVVRRGDAWTGRIAGRELRLTNLTKPYWPEDGLTKGDLLTYYFNAARLVLPHVHHHPLTLKRMPDGIGGAYFYEKDAPAYTPEWMPRLTIETDTGRTIRFVTMHDEASLLWVVNLGCIELHPHHSVGDQQERPAYAVFDLDPFLPAGWDEVRYIAGLVKTVLDRLDLPNFPKMSGLTGIQVYVPLDGMHPYPVVRDLVVKVCRLIMRAEPALTTMEWEVSQRAGKVFLDANMNRAGASLAAAFSLRAAAGAPVAMPFEWNDLELVRPEDHHLSCLLDRLPDHQDPSQPVLRGPPARLGEALQHLGIA